MDAARSSNGFGVNPVGFVEIEAWARLSGHRLAAWEIKTLRSMDTARLAHLNKRKDGPGETEVSDRELSPALFDAMFGGAG